ncbi:MAG: LysR family transcriptional regulator [Planctomycetes bacterium]|nr:LysR family transcriptional regulator [Planctomycetota bacterium]
MEMHQLRYFVAVARTGSFSRAAEQCHISQPSLSQQIQKLERGLKQKLFDRLGRRVLLTAAGRMLLDRATVILSEVDDATRQLREGDDERGGRLSIGAIPTIAPYLLPAALEKLLAAKPDVELSIHEGVTQQLLAATVGGDLDLAIVALPINEDRLHVEELFSEPLYLAVPRRHHLARCKSITIEDLQAERFILLDEMHCLGDQVLSFCNANGCQPRIACRSAQIMTIQLLIAQGQGISLIPEMARRADAGGGKVYRRLAGTQPMRSIAAVWHRHRHHGPAAEMFLTGLREIGKKFEKIRA